MAFGVKTNERPGTRATVKYARLSPSKARAVLDLIRNKSVGEARELLQFSDRGASEVVSKCLESAIANAENNDEIPGDELFVSACYADEGPTLKRWRPRARGRATRINKRTSHITVIVTRYSPDDLVALRERAGSRGGAGDAEARAQRVARSRGEDPEAAAAEVDADEVEADETETVEVEAAEVEAVEEVADVSDSSDAEDAEQEVEEEKPAPADGEASSGEDDDQDASAADEED
jgi:large subunit ribosomal protein L22